MILKNYQYFLIGEEMPECMTELIRIEMQWVFISECMYCRPWDTNKTHRHMNLAMANRALWSSLLDGKRVTPETSDTLPQKFTTARLQYHVATARLQYHVELLK